MTEVFDNADQFCADLDQFVKEISQICSRFEMKSSLYMEGVANGHPKYRTTWEVDYTTGDHRCSLFMPRSLDGLGEEGSSVKKRIDHVRGTVAVKHQAALAFADRLILLCLNGHTNTFFKLTCHEKEGPQITLVYEKYGTASSQVLYKKMACPQWDALLTYMVRTSVENEMFSPRDFDQQPMIVQNFVKRVCENLNSANPTASHILRARLDDEINGQEVFVYKPKKI